VHLLVHFTKIATFGLLENEDSKEDGRGKVRLLDITPIDVE
jgi:hypothetical protein